MNEGLNNQTRHEPQKKKHALRAAERQVVAIAKVKRDGPDPPDEGEPVPDDEPVDLPQPRHQRRTQNQGFAARLRNGIAEHNVSEVGDSLHCDNQRRDPDGDDYRKNSNPLQHRAPRFCSDPGRNQPDRKQVRAEVGTETAADAQRDGAQQRKSLLAVPAPPAAISREQRKQGQSGTQRAVEVRMPDHGVNKKQKGSRHSSPRREHSAAQPKSCQKGKPGDENGNHDERAPSVPEDEIDKAPECEDRKSTRLNSSHVEISYA